MGNARCRLTAIACIGTLAAGVLSAAAQGTAGVRLLPGLGDYSHPIATSSPDAQKYFDQGLILLYNFNHAEAERSFLHAAELDPKAPMPWWGVGVALGLNYNRDVARLEGERLRRAYEAAQKAVALSRGGSPVEAALADALATRYSLDPAADPDVLNRRYRDAMRQVHERMPDDPDVATMYADAVMNLRPWELWAHDGTPAADTPELVSLLESVLRRYPNHPGANHYYIHAVEASPTPERALASAARLETLVPGAGHLVHMPTHIYTHTGDLDKIAPLNARAAEADERYIETARPEGVYPFMYYGHNIHFVIVGAIMTGQYDLAREQAQKFAALVEPHVDEMAAMAEWTLTLTPLTDIRFHRWDAILSRPAPPASRTLLTAVDAYGRALALQSTGKHDAAVEQAHVFERARAAVPDEIVMVGFNPAKSVLAILSDVLAGQLAGNVDDAVRHLQSAAAAQDALHYDEPEPLPWSVRETLGAVLLKAARFAEAEQVFRDDLRRMPRSGRALFGLFKSLEGQGRTAEASLVEREYTAAWRQATEPLTVDALF